MNAVEIAEAVSALVERPFDAADVPYAFLQAFGNKDATISRLRAGGVVCRHRPGSDDPRSGMLIA